MTFEEKALAAGGHLADDVASVMLAKPETCTIEDVPEATIRLGVLFGLMRRAEDGVHELTEKGSTYFRGWLKQKLAAAQFAASLVSEDPALD